MQDAQTSISPETRPKIRFDSLSIEITRRCNARCAHCMRGEPRDADLRPEALDALLSRTESIYSLTITGGEPALNPEGISLVADALRRHGVGVGGAYIVTNALDVSGAFVRSLFDILSLCEPYEPELSGIAVSRDCFHPTAPPGNEAKLRLFAAYREDDKATDFHKYPLLDLGRARNLSGFPKRGWDPPGHPFEYAEIKPDGAIDLCDAQCSLTVDGDLLYMCDYEYGGEDGIKVCNVLCPAWFDALRGKAAEDMAYHDA